MVSRCMTEKHQQGIIVLSARANPQTAYKLIAEGFFFFTFFFEINKLTAELFNAKWHFIGTQRPKIILV